MKLTQAIAFIGCTLVSVAAAAPKSAAASAATSNPGPFTYLFTVTLNFGKPYKPIPTPTGGLQLVVPIAGGNVKGPAANATIAPGGIAYPVINKMNTFQDTNIVLAGTTDDGQPFLVQEDSVGDPLDHWSRIIITAPGKYSYLQRNFILGHHIQTSETKITVPCWCVGEGCGESD